MVTPSMGPALAITLVAIARFTEEALSQPLLCPPSADRALQPVAAVAVLTPCVLGPIAVAFLWSHGVQPFAVLWQAHVQWHPVLLASCSMFGMLSFSRTIVSGDAHSVQPWTRSDWASLCESLL
jgi:hypothetical protein